MKDLMRTLNRSTCLIIFALVPLGTPILTAQAAMTPDSLLDRLTREAIAASPALMSKRAAARAADLRVGPAGALPDPMVSVGVMDLTLPGFGFRESDFTEVDFEIAQSFPWPGSRKASTLGGEASARFAHAQVDALAREATVRTAESYYRLRYLRAAHVILARQSQLLWTAVGIADSRYETGSAPQSDALQARLALAQLGSDDAMLIEEEGLMRARLRALRDAAAADSFTVDPLALAELTSAFHHHDSASAQVEPSFADHPRLLARQATVEAAEQMVRTERLAGRPDFTVSLRYGARPIASDFFSAFVGVRIPLWAGRKQRRLAVAAEQDVVAAQSDLEEETTALHSEIDATRVRIQTSESRLHLILEQILPIARETVESTLRLYRVGQVNFANLLAAEDALFRTEREATELAAEHYTHLVMLRQLLDQGSGS